MDDQMKHLKALTDPVKIRDYAEIRENRKRDEQRRIERNAALARIPRRYIGQTLFNYEVSNPDQSLSLAKCRDYALNFASVLECGANLILLGAPGTGKTHLACAILQHIQGNGYSGLYTTHENLRAHLRASYDGDAEQREREAKAAFISPELLVIDELERAKGDPATVRKDLSDIINDRYGRYLPTIIVSNLSSKGLKLYLGGQDRNLWDRLTGLDNHSGLIEMNWTSYRNPLP